MAKADAQPKQTNPKQLLILAALFVVLVTVGVVQFGGLLGGDGAPDSNPAPAQGNAGNAPRNLAQQEATTPPTGMPLPPLTPRDPFRPTIQTAPAQPPAETSKVVRREPAPRREITGTPALPPLTLPAGQLGLQPAEPTSPAEPQQPHYTVTGVVLGPNSVAILADREGRRRFAKQGDLLEEGWRVVRIERGKVLLRKGNQQLTVRVGESSAPNGGNTP